jgi:hypothetical protein
MSPTSNPALTAGPSGSRLIAKTQAGAEIAARDAALGEELIDDAVDGRARDR